MGSLTKDLKALQTCSIERSASKNMKYVFPNIP